MKRVLIKRFMKDAISLESFYQMFKFSILAFLLFHVFTCLWVREGLMNPESWIYNCQNHQNNQNIEFGFIENKEETALSKIIPIYFSAFYFVTTTMSRVGYGDYKAVSEVEKCYCTIMLLCSFLVFGYLIGNDRLKQKSPQLEHVLNEAKIDIENYVYNIDKAQKDNKIDPQYYDTIVELVLQQLQYSPATAFKQNKFFKNLPPKLKTRIVEESMQKTYEMFEFFFVDKAAGSQPDRVFVRKILSSLQSKVFMPGNPIVHAG